jgi:hypothetical protein
MSKSKDNTKQPAHIEQLLKNGTAVLSAKTRDELTEMVNTIPADCKYAVGAVGRSQDGCTYTLQVDIIKN